MENRLLKKDIINIDAGRKPLKFYRRFVHNALAIAFSDALMVFGSIIVGKLLLWWINDIPFSVGYGFMIVPVWTMVAAVARLLPGWGLGVVDELRRVQGALCIMFTVVLVISFFSKVQISQSRIVFLFTYLFSAVLIPLARAMTRGLIIRFGQWGVPVAVYGDKASVTEVIEAMRSEKSLGYNPSAVNMMQRAP